MREVLDRLFTGMRERGFPMVDSLRPGLSPEEIARLTAPLPFALPQELVSLFQYTDGVPDTAPYMASILFNSSRLLPLAEAVEFYQRLLPWEISEGPRPTWFPLLVDDDHKVHLVMIDLGNEQTAPLAVCYSHDPDPDTVYDSVTRFFVFVDTCFREGAVIPGSDLPLETQYDLYGAIHQRFGFREWEEFNGATSG